MLAAAEDCWKLYVHEGRTKARDTAEHMGKAGTLRGSTPREPQPG